MGNEKKAKLNEAKQIYTSVNRIPIENERYHHHHRLFLQFALL